MSLSFLASLPNASTVIVWPWANKKKFYLSVERGGCSVYLTKIDQFVLWRLQHFSSYLAYTCTKGKTPACKRKQSGFSLWRKACLQDLKIFPDEREFVWLFSFLYALVYFTSFTLTNSIVPLLRIQYSCCRSLIFPVSTPNLLSGYQMLLSRSVPEMCVSTTRGCSERFLPLSASLAAESITEVLLKQTLFWPRTCLSLLPPCSARRNI